MERLRFVADLIAVAQAEDADNRTARRSDGRREDGGDGRGGQCPLIGAFAGPETIPQELLDPGLLERIRNA